MLSITSILPGIPFAPAAAELVAQRIARAQWSQALLLVPSRRSAAALREALRAQLGEASALLPRIVPLAELPLALPLLLGDEALQQLRTVPPPMPAAYRRMIMTQQVMAFERARRVETSLTHGLALADRVIALHDRALRSGVTLSSGALRALAADDTSEHWQQALAFLAILSERWPEIERASGMIPAPAHEAQLVQLLARHWREKPPETPVFAMGSSASQAATAQLLATIAALPAGLVVLPGFDPRLTEADYQHSAPGHPLYHMTQWLTQVGVSPTEVSLVTPSTQSLWLDVLAPSETMASDRQAALPTTHAPLPLQIIACKHVEEEARVISLLVREALEQPSLHVAVVTPDEALLARVAAHVKRYGILADRTRTGTLAESPLGSAWVALMQHLVAPVQARALRRLLHHPLLAVDPAVLDALEPGWFGPHPRMPGALPPHDRALISAHPQYAMVKERLPHWVALGRLSLTASAWIEAVQDALTPFSRAALPDEDAMADALDEMRQADLLGGMDAHTFLALLRDALRAPCRDLHAATEPRLHLLTPVEARMLAFDRVILAAMHESVWPGVAAPDPWLNRHAQRRLGLALVEEEASLVAHDLMMLTSAGDVYVTYAVREAGSPTTRSRYLERLLAWGERRGIAPQAWRAERYRSWAAQRDMPEAVVPSAPASALPTAMQRPRSLHVSDLDLLQQDPYRVYVKYVLQLAEPEEMDEMPSARDFGSLTHRAIEALTQHWNTHHAPADTPTLNALAQRALAPWQDTPAMMHFWQHRLLLALEYVNALEIKRRPYLRAVRPEQPLQGTLAGVLLEGKMDRLEQRAEGDVIADYKTGDAPSGKAILEGKALQLLVYALLWQQSAASHTDGADAPARVSLLEYWVLPKAGKDAKLTEVVCDDALLSEVARGVEQLLRQMQLETTPFIATGKSAVRAYDGLSRYDEWAG
jgi:ATP-dependent helicase/nuclease subunit B